MPNGHEIDQFHVIEAPDWASVLCRTKEGRVVLVRQYRHGIAGPSIELPAGVIEPGEAPLAAAQRELAEETGFEAERWLPLATFATDPSRHTTRAHFFCALDAVRVRSPSLDAAEDIEVHEVERDELVRLVEHGEMLHGVHVAAVLLALRRELL